jgi:hypothetical protein
MTRHTCTHTHTRTAHNPTNAAGAAGGGPPWARRLLQRGRAVRACCHAAGAPGRARARHHRGLLQAAGHPAGSRGARCVRPRWRRRRAVGVGGVLLARGRVLQRHARGPTLPALAACTHVQV